MLLDRLEGVDDAVEAAGEMFLEIAQAAALRVELARQADVHVGDLLVQEAEDFRQR
jgi:hypothetical protein